MLLGIGGMAGDGGGGGRGCASQGIAWTRMKREKDERAACTLGKWTWQSLKGRAGERAMGMGLARRKM